MKNRLLRISIAAAATLTPVICSAQTLVSGNISGTWSPSGNPYIATDNCTVPSGETLTIQPGVVFLIGDGLSVTISGNIQAIGTPSQRITFQPPISSQTWSNLFLNYYSGWNHGSVTSRFRYCDFSNARTAIKMGVYGGYGQGTTNTIRVEIVNCSFSNCVSQAILGEVQPDLRGYAALYPVIRNCSFRSASNGCLLTVSGRPSAYYVIYGWSCAQVIGNVFENLAGTALLLGTGGDAGTSEALLLNNTVANCRIGLDVADPWNAKVQNSVFVGCTNAVKVSGSLSRNISFNCFYQNRTNFIGYPATYGTAIWPNRNGTMSDALYNIFQDPQFVSATDFHLQPTSPCIDAGTPDWNYSDMCFSNGVSQGTSFPDLGAYGGPDAANWLDNVPLVPVQASLTRSANRVFTVSWGAIPRSEYQVQWTTNMPGALSTNWFNVSNGWIRATDKYTAINVATNPPAVERYYRVKSLGRTPGY